MQWASDQISNKQIWKIKCKPNVFLFKCFEEEKNMEDEEEKEKGNLNLNSNTALRIF